MMIRAGRYIQYLKKTVRDLNVIIDKVEKKNGQLSDRDHEVIKLHIHPFLQEEKQL